MSEKKRRWFQIHLSTAIAMMLVASSLLGLNFAMGGWPFYVE